MEDVPTEIIYRIALELGGDDCHQLSKVNKLFSVALRTFHIWKRKLARDYPNFDLTEMDYCPEVEYINLERGLTKLIPLYYNKHSLDARQKNPSLDKDLILIRSLKLTAKTGFNELIDIVAREIEGKVGQINIKHAVLRFMCRGTMFIGTPFVKREKEMTLGEYPHPSSDGKTRKKVTFKNSWENFDELIFTPFY